MQTWEHWNQGAYLDFKAVRHIGELDYFCNMLKTKAPLKISYRESTCDKILLFGESNNGNNKILDKVIV